MRNRDKNTKCNNCTCRPFQCPADVWLEDGMPIVIGVCGNDDEEVHIPHCYEPIGGDR